MFALMGIMFSLTIMYLISRMMTLQRHVSKLMTAENQVDRRIGDMETTIAKAIHQETEALALNPQPPAAPPSHPTQPTAPPPPPPTPPTPPTPPSATTSHPTQPSAPRPTQITDSQPPQSVTLLVDPSESKTETCENPLIHEFFDTNTENSDTLIANEEENVEPEEIATMQMKELEETGQSFILPPPDTNPDGSALDHDENDNHDVIQPITKPTTKPTRRSSRRINKSQ